MNKAFRKPDVKGPRFREKSKKLLDMKLYERFIDKFPEYNISFKEFKDIITTYNKNLYEGIMEYRDGVELPESLGYVFIGSCPPLTKRINVDFVKSGQYGIITQHRNWDSNSKVMKIFYTNRPVKYKIQNKQIWRFAPVREFKRAASKAYKEDFNKYMDIINTRRISTLFKQKMNINVMQENFKKYRVASTNYNEFDL